jgi:hypothetical protein
MHNSSKGPEVSLQRHAGAQQDVSAKAVMDLRKSGDTHFRMLTAQLATKLLCRKMPAQLAFIANQKPFWQRRPRIFCYYPACPASRLVEVASSLMCLGQFRENNCPVA